MRHVDLCIKYCLVSTPSHSLVSYRQNLCCPHRITLLFIYALACCVTMPVPGAWPASPAKLTLEAWSQGCMIGALIIMIGITLANMRRGVLLHKLILIEVSISVTTALIYNNNHLTHFVSSFWQYQMAFLPSLILRSGDGIFPRLRFSSLFRGTYITLSPG